MLEKPSVNVLIENWDFEKDDWFDPANRFVPNKVSSN